MKIYITIKHTKQGANDKIKKVDHKTQNNISLFIRKTKQKTSPFMNIDDIKFMHISLEN